MTAALTVGILVAGGVYLMLRRDLLRVTLGFVLLGHAVNVLFVTGAGLNRRAAPLLKENGAEATADPLPQAFVLTAIVITFGITVYLLALLRAEGLRRRHTGRGDGNGGGDADGAGDGARAGDGAGDGGGDGDAGDRVVPGEERR